jgi:hypothetical protein
LVVRQLADLLTQRLRQSAFSAADAREALSAALYRAEYSLSRIALRPETLRPRLGFRQWQLAIVAGLQLAVLAKLFL